MKEREERRRFWTAVAARFEGSGNSRKEFAAEAGEGLAMFQYWLYNLRRERGAQARPVPEVGLLFVTVRARPSARLEIRWPACWLRVPVGADPAYVARLAVALRETRPF